jgi:hypothetical protein
MVALYNFLRIRCSVAEDDFSLTTTSVDVEPSRIEVLEAVLADDDNGSIAAIVIDLFRRLFGTVGQISSYLYSSSDPRTSVLHGCLGEKRSSESRESSRYFSSRFPSSFSWSLRLSFTHNNMVFPKTK